MFLLYLCSFSVSRDSSQHICERNIFLRKSLNSFCANNDLLLLVIRSDVGDWRKWKFQIWLFGYLCPTMQSGTRILLCAITVMCNGTQVCMNMLFMKNFATLSANTRFGSVLCGVSFHQEDKASVYLRIRNPVSVHDKTDLLLLLCFFHSLICQQVICQLRAKRIDIV